MTGTPWRVPLLRCFPARSGRSARLPPSAFFYPCTSALETHWVDKWDAALVYDALAHGLGERQQAFGSFSSQVLPGRQGQQIGTILDRLSHLFPSGCQKPMFIQHAALLQALGCCIPLLVAPAAYGLHRRPGHLA